MNLIINKREFSKTIANLHNKVLCVSQGPMTIVWQMPGRTLRT